MCRAAGGRVISLHSRRAAGEVLDAIESIRDAGTPILHWFSGTGRQLDRAIDLGCWFSVGPAMLRTEKGRSDEHTSELQSLMRISYAVFCLKNKTRQTE